MINIISELETVLGQVHIAIEVLLYKPVRNPVTAILMSLALHAYKELLLSGNHDLHGINQSCSL